MQLSNFVNHSYNYRLNRTPLSLIPLLISHLARVFILLICRSVQSLNQHPFSPGIWLFEDWLVLFPAPSPPPRNWNCFQMPSPRVGFDCLFFWRRQDQWLRLSWWCFLVSLFWIKEKKIKLLVLAHIVACCLHQSHCCIRVCISHQLDCHIRVCIWHQSYHSILTLCTNHSVWVLFSYKWCHGSQRCAQRMTLTRNFGLIC